MWEEPTIEEVKVVVYGLNGDSTSDPDVFTRHFYHIACDIIGEDVLNMVRAFFYGAELPKFITHTNLVLLPKKKKM